MWTLQVEIKMTESNQLLSHPDTYRSQTYQYLCKLNDIVMVTLTQKIDRKLQRILTQKQQLTHLISGTQLMVNSILIYMFTTICHWHIRVYEKARAVRSSKMHLYV